jgi:hypothetical protein
MCRELLAYRPDATSAAPQSKENGLPPAEDLPLYTSSSSRGTGKPRVVVLGSGWGAMSFLKSLPRNVACAPPRSRPRWPQRRVWLGNKLMGPGFGRAEDTPGLCLARLPGCLPGQASSLCGVLWPPRAVHGRGRCSRAGAPVTCRAARGQLTPRRGACRDSIDLAIISPRNYFLYTCAPGPASLHCHFHVAQQNLTISHKVPFDCTHRSLSDSQVRAGL